MRQFDVVVVGVGAMGSAALWHLARRGLKVLGLERFDMGHLMGSSHGFNRIIRLAYFEHPSYVPLLRRAFELWRETERCAGEQLLYMTGGLDIGDEQSRVVRGALASCRDHGLPHRLMTGTEVNRQFPGYRLPQGFAAVYQPDAGFVASERAVLAQASLAAAAGAELHARERVLAIEPRGDHAVVVTEHDRYEAGRVITSAGAWISDLVPELRGRAVAERQVLGWFQPKRPELFDRAKFPVSNLLSEQGHFYQFPIWGVPGFKIGRYHHLLEQGHPDDLSRIPTARDEAALREAIRAFFPEADGAVLRLDACLFTNTADEHFVIDTLPDNPAIIIASPCSGHGFKFASVIGEILSDLAITGSSAFDLSLFSLARLSQ